MTEPDEDVLASAAAGGKAIRGGLLRTVTYVGTLGLGLVSVPLMTRHLGVDSFGYYVTVSVIVQIIGGFTEAGLTNIGIREYSNLSGERGTRYLQALAGMRFALTAAGVGLAILFSLTTGQPHEVVLGTAIAGLGLFLGLAQQTYAIPLFAALRFGWLSLLDVVKQVVLVAGIVLCILLNAGLVPFFWANVASGAAVLVVTAFLVRSHGLSLWPAVDRATWARVGRLTVPFALATVAGLVYFRLGVLLLGYVDTEHEVGIYSTAFRVTEVLTPVPFVAVTAAFPILARAAMTDSDRMRYTLQRVFEGSLLVGSLVVIALTFGSRFVIGVIAPIEQYGAAVPVLRVQAVAILFTFLQAAFSFALLSLERYRAFVTANFVALAMSGVAGGILAPSLGGMGAAIATAAAEATLATGYLVVLKRNHAEIAPSLAVVPRVAVAGGAAALVALAGLASLPSAALAGVVFAVVAILTGAVPRELLTALLRRDPG